MNVVLFARGFMPQYSKEMAEFLVDHLGLRNSRYNLGIIGLQKKKKNAALVTHDDKGIILHLDFRRPFHELASTVAHEMIHVKQICKGRLRQTKDGMIWKGKKYKNRKLPPYLDRQWELEALREQDILARLYEEHLFTFVRMRDRIASGRGGKHHAVRKVRRKHSRRGVI